MEPLNKGHFGTSHILSSIERVFLFSEVQIGLLLRERIMSSVGRLSLSWRFKMDYCSRKEVQNCVLSSEVVTFSEGPLLEVPLVMHTSPPVCTNYFRFPEVEKLSPPILQLSDVSANTDG